MKTLIHILFVVSIMMLSFNSYCQVARVMNRIIKTSSSKQVVIERGIDKMIRCINKIATNQFLFFHQVV
jgi:hypothetical protein